MKKFSRNKEINSKVRELIQQGWYYRSGKKHPSVISPDGWRLIIPSTPSDWRAFYNFCRDVRHIMNKGMVHAI